MSAPLEMAASLAPRAAKTKMRSAERTHLLSVGYGINDSGQVAGYAEFPVSPNDDVTRAALFSNGTTTDLGTLGGTMSYGYGINASGQVTGTAERL